MGGVAVSDERKDQLWDEAMADREAVDSLEEVVRELNQQITTAHALGISVELTVDYHLAFGDQEPSCPILVGRISKRIGGVGPR